MVNMTMEPQISFALVNGRVVLPDHIADGQAVVIEIHNSVGKIGALLSQDQLPPNLPRFDAGGRWIIPGLIDIHTHGALGHTFNEPTELAFSTILEENLRRGVTGLLATVGAAPFAE